MCYIFQWFTQCRHFNLRELSEIDMYKHQCYCKAVINDERVQRVDGLCVNCEMLYEGKITKGDWETQIAKMQQMVLEQGPDLQKIRVA
ncbi:hypothetical protein TWF694_002306 [Orbilia ellipsospora]|uniref:Uncharacterized protein n=1 Tax=Orbilia ellipsospora TaxID=2528407 RepID=A0AAV9X1J3_9PEZI